MTNINYLTNEICREFTTNAINNAKAIYEPMITQAYQNGFIIGVILTLGCVVVYNWLFRKT